MGIEFEAISRFLSPVAISFNEAIPIGVLGLAVNVVSAWLLSGGDHHGDSHSHSHGHDDLHDHDDDLSRIDLGGRTIELEVFEDGVPPRFRMRVPAAFPLKAADITIETTQRFTFVHLGDYLESSEEVPEPHEFQAAIFLKEAANRKSLKNFSPSMTTAREVAPIIATTTCVLLSFT